MFKPTFAAILPLLLAAPFSAHAQPITAADLLSHMKVLADDSYEGRKPGTAGGKRTEAYLIAAFARMGLQPGAAHGLWRQPVDIVERHLESFTATWRAGRKATMLDGGIAWLGRQSKIGFDRAPVIFAGHGTAEELDGRDLKGAVLLTLQGPVPANRRRLDTAALAARGAVGVVSILTAKEDWAKYRAYWLEDEAYILGSSPIAEGILSSAEAGALLGMAGLSLDALRSQAAAPGFRAVKVKADVSLNLNTGVRPLDTANIVAKVPGSGRADEAVIFLSHWDHLGICRPEGAADRICNGAVDNASGTAILLETARRIAAGPRPDRSIYFIATTAEEMGLLGADALGAAPPVAKERIVAALNLDTTAIGPAGLPVAILGRGNHPAIDKVVDEEARKIGRKIDTDTEANVMITRQDGWALAKRGVPTIMATGSISDMNLLRSYLGGTYHKPDDDIAHATELEGAVEDANLHVALARALADPSRLPSP
ncbi:M28 family peptidase [Allosphingosinicella flava]|uniref:M28 family peptidase n=1 Tax=Allosphingosinicella flava TaxID=2771430 RepID=A0A7T2GKP7_9SPHN|nr:M28 family peptidase [Sphingosinicella flava]QPQ55651.1 M28 family peptidase [Sphingosinicella flava]